MLHLMNSAMMPCEGNYYCKKITPTEAKRAFELVDGEYKSYIGYPNSCRILSELFGTKIALCRDSTDLRDGDTMLAMRLRYRVIPHDKQGRKHGQNLEDYDFFLITYFVREN